MRKTTWILLAALSLGCAGQITLPPHPYTGLVSSDMTYFLQLGQPESFLKKAFDITRYLEIKEIQGQDWKEALLLEINDTNARSNLADFLESLDTSQPLLLAGNIQHQNFQFIFSVKSPLSEKLREMFEEDSTVKITGNIVSVKSLREGGRELAEAVPLDLTPLNTLREPLLSVYAQPLGTEWNDTIGKLGEIAGIGVDLRLDPNPIFSFYLKTNPGTPISDRLAKIGSETSGSLDMLRRLPSDSLLAGGSHLNYKEYTNFLSEVLSQLDLPVEEFIEQMEKAPQQGNLSGSALSFRLRDGQLLRKPFPQTERLMQYLDFNYTILTDFQDLKDFIEPFSSSYSAFLPLDMVESIKQVRKESITIEGMEVTRMNFSQVLESFPLTLLFKKAQPLNVIDISTTNSETSPARLRAELRQENYPFPEDTEIASFLDVIELVKLVSKDNLGERTQDGKIWVWASTDAIGMTSGLKTNWETVKLALLLAKKFL